MSRTAISLDDNTAAMARIFDIELAYAQRAHVSQKREPTRSDAPGLIMASPDGPRWWQARHPTPFDYPRLTGITWHAEGQGFESSEGFDSRSGAFFVFGAEDVVHHGCAAEDRGYGHVVSGIVVRAGPRPDVVMAGVRLACRT